MKHPVCVLLICFFTMLKSNGQLSMEERLISDFYQTTVVINATMKKCVDDKVWGNCVVIGLIKTALAQFGTVKDIYRSCEIENNAARMVFNDGLAVELTKDDITVANQYARFGKGENSVYYDSAIIIYASICKRIQIHKAGVIESQKRCINSFTDAIHFINSGYSTDNSGILLGLKLERKNLSELNNLPFAMIRTSAHTAFCTKGVQDNLGDKFSIINGRMKNPASGPRAIKRVYIFKK
jgi:hypothetical protein